ncbi:MAG TPA: DEAD/DEAH box helicase [Candidatus Acidoferrales bacterium]|nr:DEAD/DEAH box helicase [Candidatus Acidoferrales bacterium]
MPLSTRLGFQFDKRVQIKGASFSGKSIKVTDSGPSFVYAEVRDTQLYSVRLVYQDGKLLVSCGCPYYLDFGQCKHLWAVVLEADRRAVLQEALKARYLEIEDVLAEDDDLAAEDPEPEPNYDYSYDYRRPRYPIVPPPPPIPAWQEYLGAIHRGLEQRKPQPANLGRDSETLFAIDVPSSRTTGAVVLEMLTRTRKKDGEWSVPKELRISAASASSLPDPVDAEVIATMFGGYDSWGYQYSATVSSALRKSLPYILALKLIPMISATGRLMIRPEAGVALQPATWDEGEPWKLWLEVKQDDHDQWKISGSLRRGEERMELSEPMLLLEYGLLVTRGRVARLDHGGAFAWITQLRTVKTIPFPDRERDLALEMILKSPVLPPMELDPALNFEERQAPPRLGLRVTQKHPQWGADYYLAHLLLDYGRGWTDDKPGGRGAWIPEERVYYRRHPEAERVARETLATVGLKPESDSQMEWRCTPKALPGVVRELVHAGWHVEAEGKAFRKPGETRVNVTSGIDWFELHGEVDYGEVSASLPELLAASRRGDGIVALGDGTFGLLPTDWMERFAPLAGLGSKEEDHLRFRRNQAGLLDALLAAQPEVQVDEMFQRVRERLRSFQGVKAAVQPEGFVGHLRDYQREGVGWMEFLREFGFGGCLADDMGVGKTAQMLAVLESRRVEARGPSLVVAPKSLMFNWRAEATRFTPQLRVLVHTGLARDTAAIGEYDLILTTYGTLLRDVTQLSEVAFDYVVLDEAQAIKNASTASAKAVRLLRGQHRMVLSGTPVENHLGELWSLFEFLNPGMLGEAKVLKMTGGLGRNPSPEARQLLGQALRPFILRRTKQQVARELPAKTEQTIYCELEGSQKKQYEELKAHYRNTLLQRVQTQGLGRSKMHVLEALLRLRQAACHPGLIDPRQAGEPSAKLDVLMEQLAELREEGHKALVFSQFTSLLAIVRKQLDKKGVKYEYLDGATTNRQKHVEAFQNDPACELFLISLKAGGLGLNLTAAEYVFLLDPWWNPAVEAQAVDRAHRIGQTRPVFAYRLIARDTVEEKVLELQKTKRQLADAILGEDNSLIRDLKKEDLELLLS